MINCVLVGDMKVGKSALVKSYLSKFQLSSISSYEPTTLERYTVENELPSGVRKPGKVSLNLIDTGGQKEMDRLRPLCYADAHVFLLCFSVVVPSTFQSLMSKWLPEIKRHTVHRKISLMLIGTQSDLRSNITTLLKLVDKRQVPVTESNAITWSEKIGAKTYMECSALTQKNVQQVFDYVMLSGLENHFHTKSDKENIPICGPRQFNLPSSYRGIVHGKKGRQLRQLLSKPWNLKKSNKVKRVLLLSCFFNY